MQILPNEILEKIFINLDANVIKQLNKNWKKFTEKHSKLFKVLTIDLLHSDIKILKKFNPITIKISCSQIYKEMSIPVNDGVSDDVKSLEDRKILMSINEKLNVIKRYSSLKTIIAKFDLIYFKSDKYTIHKYPYEEGVRPKKTGNSTLSLFCIKKLLKCNVQNFFLTFFNEKQKYNWRVAIRYECWFKDIFIRIGYKFDKFIYKGSNKMLLLYDRKSKTFIFRAGDLRKFSNLKIPNQPTFSNYICVRSLKKYDLENVYIYNNIIDSNFKLSCTYLYNILNLTYYYFVEKNSRFYTLFKNSDKKKFDKKMIIKSGCNIKDFLLNTLKTIRPYELIILKNDENFVKKILKYIKIDDLY